jgi:hypothetical protein
MAWPSPSMTSSIPTHSIMWILHETAPLSIAAEPITSQPFEMIRELHRINAASIKS